MKKSAKETQSLRDQVINPSGRVRAVEIVVGLAFGATGTSAGCVVGGVLFLHGVVGGEAVQLALKKKK